MYDSSSRSKSCLVSFNSSVKLACSVPLICMFMSRISHLNGASSSGHLWSLFYAGKPAFQSKPWKVVSAVSGALCRFPVNRVVCESLMFSNVVFDIINYFQWLYVK